MSNLPRDIADLRFAAVAAIGNGQEPAEVVELGVVTIDARAVSSAPLVWLVRPARPITTGVMRARGISNDDVAAAPSLPEVLADVTAVLDRRVLLSHRVNQLVELLTPALADWVPGKILDTYRLAGIAFPAAVTRTLPDLLNHAGLSVAGKPGRAGCEAEAVARLFVAMINRFEISGDRLFAIASAHLAGAGS